MTATALRPATSLIQQLTADRLGEFTAWCAADRGDFALDTETTGLDTRECGFAVTHLAFGATDGTAWVVDGSDGDLMTFSLRAAVGARRRWWAHNASYDAAALHAVTGLRFRGLLCTQVLTAALSPDVIGVRGASSLKKLRPTAERAQDALRDRYVSFGGDSTAKSWLADAMTVLPFADTALLNYVATDAVECARLVGDWRTASTKLHRSIAMRECKIEDLWRWASGRGHRVDLDMLRTEIDNLGSARQSGIRAHGLDLMRDTDDTRRWLAIRGIRISTLDDKPTLSHKRYKFATVPDTAREDWAAFCALRETARTANKLKEVERSASATGRVHPSIRAIGAVTGRMAIGRPALQNLPGSLRGLLLAEPDYVLLGCDLDRVEPCIVAAVSGDPDLTEAVKKDVYVELAAAIWGEAARDDETMRKVAKTALLALMYGKGNRTLAVDLGVTEAEAKQVSQDLLSTYPVMAAWMNGVKRRAEAGLPYETVFGRPLPPTSHKSYRAVNYTIQGSAADLFKQLTIAVAAALGRDTLWLPVHDELIVQVPEADAERAVELLGQAMSTELLGVPIKGTPVILGTRWAKA